MGDAAYTVDGADKQFYRERYGEFCLNGGTTYSAQGLPIKVVGVSELMGTDAYKSASDKEKAEMIEATVKAAKIGASCEAAARVSPDANVFDPSWAVFREDYESGSEYMAMAYDVYSRIADTNALPHPAEKFTQDKVTYKVGSNQAGFNAAYRDALELISASWDIRATR